MDKNKIYKTMKGKRDFLIIEVPWLTERCNPYVTGKQNMMDNIIALIEEDPKCNVPNMGFAYQIDMSYKGKSNQFTDFFYKFFGTEEEFEKLCKKLKIDIAYINL